MMTNTQQLFGSLIKTLHLDCVCDVGSKDGRESLFFRDILPDANVISFEANPFNYHIMQSNRKLLDRVLTIASQRIVHIEADKLDLIEVEVSIGKDSSRRRYWTLVTGPPHEETNGLRKCVIARAG